MRGGSGVDIVRSTVAGIVEEAMMETYETMKEKNCSFRMAALINGIERIKSRIKDVMKYWLKNSLTIRSTLECVWVKIN